MQVSEEWDCDRTLCKINTQGGSDKAVMPPWGRWGVT